MPAGKASRALRTQRGIERRADGTVRWPPARYRYRDGSRLSPVCRSHGAYPRTVEVQIGSLDGPGRDANLRPDPAGGTFVLDGAMSGSISTGAYRAGFDCEQAATPVETTICGNELLARGDLEMNVLYREIIESGGAAREQSLRSGQREFISRRDNECQTTDGGVDEGCIARLYSDRLVALRRLGDPSLGGGPRFDADLARRRGDSLFRHAFRRVLGHRLDGRAHDARRFGTVVRIAVGVPV